MLKFIRLLGVLCLGLSISLHLFAQETTSDIQGTITDGKEGLAGATVVAIHTPSGTRYATTTRKDGRFNLANVKIGGPYVITVTFVGYREEKQENIFLSLGQELKSDFTLTPESQNLSTVVVKGTGQNKIFNSGHTGSQEVITRTQIDRLPTINRSLQDFTKLEPTSAAGGLSFGGQYSGYNNVTVDGANFNNSFGLSSTLGGQTNSQPISLEAIEQIQVNVSPYDATQGGFSGAGINSVTKSGTNTFKGSVYTYIKGPGTQGYNVENTQITRSPFTYYVRGASLGGPIIKNKLFFFLSAEEVRQTAPATSQIASDANHAPGGNVSQANADTLNALSQFLISKFNYNPGAYQGYSFQDNSNKITAKLDWNVGARSTVTIKYNYLKSYADQFASTSRPGAGQVGGTTQGLPGTYAMPFEGSGYRINNNFNIVIGELNTRFGNSSSNKFQVGYTALRDFRTPHSNSTTFPLVDILNNGNIYTTFGYEPYTYNNILHTDVYQIADIFKIYRGAHELTFGTQDYYRKYQNAFAPGYNGVYQFNSLTDFYNSVNNGTANAKSYYLQYSALPGRAFPYAYAGSTELSLFAQDKWRVTNNFALTYGLRLENTIYKQAFQDNPSFDALQFKNGSTYNIGKAPGNALLVSPRVGFNWDVLGNKTLQLRGGAGIFSGPPPFVWISNQASNNGIQFGSFTNANVAFNSDPTHYLPASGAANSSYSTALTSHNFKYPSVLKYSLAVDKKLPGDFVVTLEGMGTKDINAVYFSNINLNETNATPLVGTDNRLQYAAGTGNKYYSGAGGASLTNPNIGTAILMSNTNKGYAYSLTARIQKNISNLSLSLAYTYSQSKNTAEGGSTASSLWSARAVSGDPNAPTLANASWLQPHRVIASASYKLNEGKFASTTFGAIFEATNNGTGSYVYNGDVNHDGNTGNDLIYIPKTQSDIELVPVNTGGGVITDTRTASQIWNQLNNYIIQDHYLDFHRGQYAKANALMYPFFKRLDLHLAQDFSVFIGSKEKGTRHTLSLSLDLINAGNFLNRNWGVYKLANATNFLKYEGIDPVTQAPRFSFPYLDATNQVPLTTTWKDDTSINSRWQAQFGIRYMFN